MFLEVENLVRRKWLKIVSISLELIYLSLLLLEDKALLLLNIIRGVSYVGESVSKPQNLIWYRYQVLFLNFKLQKVSSSVYCYKKKINAYLFSIH